MIQRAETVTLVYDSRTEGLKSGEESRFIKQLEYHYNLPLKRSFVKAEAKVGEFANEIPKTVEHINALRNCSLSASSIKSYLDCPAKFYFSKIERLKDEDEVAEDLDAGKLGEVYHSTMQALYMGEGAMDPSYDIADKRLNATFPGALKDISKDYIDSWLARKDDIRRRVRSLIMTQLHAMEVTGRNLVFENVIVQYVLKTLRRDKELMEKLGTDSFRILGLEKKFSTTIDGFRFEGFIDRMDSFLPGEVRVIDYKTGKVLPMDENITPETAGQVAATVFGEINKDRPKIALQMFIYDIMVLDDPEFNGKTIINSVYQPSRFFYEGVRNVPLYDDFKDDMTQRLRGLLADMADVSKPWTRTTQVDTCAFCDFKLICGR